ncbi:His Kinase A (phospho-acceptor) domain-containing protein [Lachnospiraceae bacterium YSD2013]|nr:His Kinase A (phospho-acceptor) domain-containing protein [Lachnospiraceae bacterium YSD2013]
MAQKTTFKNPGVESDTIETLSKKLLKTTAKLSAANKELSKTNNELAESERKRKEMLANISHDLRAPITAIRSALDLLSTLENPTAEDIKSTIGLMDRRVSTLESLIQDMYFLFCVEDETRPLDLEDVDLAPFLESYFYDAVIDSRYDSHDMQLDIPMDLSCHVNIDVQKTIRVLDNLFTNAAKYSGDGTSITLSCRTSGKNATITVSDNGRGIPAESLAHIFDRTYTVSSSRSPGSPTGSGLGLAIVKAVVEKEGGTVTCESEVGKGCAFVVTVPCK